MEYGAIDLHTRRSQIRLLDEAGQIVLDTRIETTHGALDRVFAGRARVRLLLESSTESEWVAQHLEGLGHEVIVADPNYLPMYGTRSRRVKTDKRDAAALAEACRAGIYRRAHRVSAAAQRLRQAMRIRRQVVQMRSSAISVLRAVLRQEGLRLASGATDSVDARVARLPLSAAVAATIAPLRTVIGDLTATLTGLDTDVTTRAQADPIARRLMTAPGVGPVVAVTFRGVLDTTERFGGDAARVSAYVGLVPREDSSGERRHRGHITKAGPGDLRALLVQASWTIWRSRRSDTAALRSWVHRLAARRGRRLAVVALARRLTRILYAMWRDATVFRMPATAVAG